MVFPGGHAWFFPGGVHGFFWGGLRGFFWGGMYGFFQGCAWFFPGGGMRSGTHPTGMHSFCFNILNFCLFH